MMLAKNISRRYLGSSENQVQPDGILAGKPAAEPAKRGLTDITNKRGLTDITNSANIPNDVSKDDKLTKKFVSAVEPASKCDVVEDSTSDNMEVDDRVYMQRVSDDIDARDADNPVLAVTYVNEMYDNFSALEKQYAVNPSYMTGQPFVNERMRAILIDWLVEVHLKFKMVPETLYLTVNLIDRYLEVKPVRRSKLQLVGVAALLLSAKYEEIYPPELRDLVYITDRAYNKQEILEMETDIVNALQYNLTVPTAHSFLCRYLKAAHADRTMVQLACYLTERSLQEYSSLQYLPSTIAATAVYIARKSLKRHPWSPTLLKYTKYDECDFAACAAEMGTYIANTASQQQAVLRKYSSPKFGGVAKMPISA